MCCTARLTVDAMKDDLKTNIETLTSHILAQQQTVKESSGDFSVWKTQVDSAQRHRGVVQVDLQCGAQGRAAQRVSENLHSIGLSGVTNVQEESQQKLDILSNDIMINMLKGSGRTCLLISEELDESIPVESQGKYAVVFDPLYARLTQRWIVKYRLRRQCGHHFRNISA